MAREVEVQCHVGDYLQCRIGKGNRHLVQISGPKEPDNRSIICQITAVDSAKAMEESVVEHSFVFQAAFQGTLLPGAWPHWTCWDRGRSGHGSPDRLGESEVV